MTPPSIIALGELLTEVRFAAETNRWAHAVDLIQTAILDRRAKAGLLRSATMSFIFDSYESARYAMTFWKRRSELIDEAALLEDVLEEARRRGEAYAVAKTTSESKLTC